MATARAKGDQVLVGGLHALPVGAMINWPTETVPTGYLERNGASLLMLDYPALYAVIGKQFGSADATHFNIPDDRGLFIRWWDHSKGNDPDAASRTKPGTTGTTIVDGDHVGTEQAFANDSHNHTQDAHHHTVNPASTTSGGVSANHTHTCTVSDPSHYHVYVFYGATAPGMGWSLIASAIGMQVSGIPADFSSSGASANHTHAVDIAEFDSGSATATNQESGGNEARPLNRAYMPLIKY